MRNFSDFSQIYLKYTVVRKIRQLSKNWLNTVCLLNRCIFQTTFLVKLTFILISPTTWDRWHFITLIFNIPTTVLRLEKLETTHTHGSLLQLPASLQLNCFCPNDSVPGRDIVHCGTLPQGKLSAPVLTPPREGSWSWKHYSCTRYRRLLPG